MNKEEEKQKIRQELKRISPSKFRGQETATPWGMMYEVNEDFGKRKISSLKKEYPGYTFRVIQCHDKSHTYMAITIDNPDPREWGEMSKHGTWDSDGCYTKFQDEK